MRHFLHVPLVLSMLAACVPPAPATGSSADPPIPPVAQRADGPAATLPAVPGLPPDDRARIAEAFRLADAIGGEIWPGWSSVPFALLLVTPEREYLVRHSRPSADFVSAGYDDLLRSEVFTRLRTFSPGLLATFPFDGIPTVVIGQPSVTGKHSTAWVLTALHEHFHQLQMSQPGYYAGVEALGLARGDQTGMWMLNYPFPYAIDSVQNGFSAMAAVLDGALAARSNADRQARLAAVAEARAQLRALLPADDDRYLSFQMWQEGVARYTELQVARWAAERYVASPAFSTLPDASPFGVTADSIAEEIRRGLRGNPLSTAGRVAFYPAGAATALLLDAAAPGWRSRYLENAFSLDAVVPGIAGSPRTGTDSAFAGVQQRGAQVMGVDQYTSAHVFESLPDGGRIILERPDVADSVGIATIREHMRTIATAFARGDFAAPGLVHAQQVPGTDVMRELRQAITYRAADRPRGAELRISTTNARAVRAVHDFLAFQRLDHRAPGHESHSHTGDQLLR